jgi:hypothetical protein
MIHEWPSDAGERPPPAGAPREPARLSRDQQWDLARMVTACVLTMGALGAAVWFIACQDERQTGRADHHLGPASPAVVITSADIVAPVTTPELGAGEAMTRPRATGGPNAPVRPPAPNRSAARRATAVAPSHSLPRRVARFITGDGRHEVRPFPTIDK